jgi:hypothetical protein
VRVLVRRHLERDALVHAVEAGHAVELGRVTSITGMPRWVAIDSISLTRSSISTRWAM